MPRNYWIKVERYAVQYSSQPCHYRSHFTLQQNFEKPCEYAKNVFKCFVDLEIQPGSLWKALRGVPWVRCWRPAITGRPSGHCIPAQKFVSVSGELNHDRSPLVLDFDKGVCCHCSFSVFISGFQRFRWGEPNPDLYDFVGEPHQSRRHGGALVTLDPPNKAPWPPNWNMKHYILWNFCQIWMPSPPCENVKPPAQT